MLIVENGTGLADSDSYVSLADARLIAAKYGVTLPTDDESAETAIRNGTLYVDMQESQFCGSRLLSTQSLAWPRVDAVNSFGFDIASDSIPPQLAKAVVMAAAEYGAGVDVRATNDGKEIASEEVTGKVAVSYFQNGKSGAAVVITKCLDALKPLLACGNNGFSFRVGRS